MRKDVEIQRLKRKYWFSQNELELFDKEGSLGNLHKTHISQRCYKALRCKLDNPAWHPLIHNKWLSMNYYRSQGIRVPETYGLVHPEFGISSNKMPLRDSADIHRWLSDNGKKNFVLKHIGGGGGKFVLIIDQTTLEKGQLRFLSNNNNVYNTNEIDSLLQEKCGGLQGFLLEEKLALHPEIIDIAKEGLSSMRIYSLTRETGEPIVKLGFLRIGAQKGLTDHPSNGGFLVPCDLGSGRLKKGLLRMGNNNSWITKNPETGVSFEGKEIPDWKEVLDLCCKAAKCSPGLNWVGWDIVLTSTGPVLLEGNVGNTISNLQYMFGGFLENGIFEEWEKHLKVERPNGSLSWRMRHRSKKGRLEFLRSRICSFLEKKQ